MSGFTRSLVIVAALVAPVAAQRPSVPASGISGRVIDAATNSPLAGAAATVEGSPSVETARTDTAGTFVLAGLSAGTHQVKVTKTGYLARTIAARSGGTVTILLTKAGAISGQIVDPLGEPLARIPVHARKYQYDADGRRSLVQAGVSDSTDDLGQFRVYGLPAGDFVVITQTARDPNSAIIVASPVVGSDIAPTYYPGTLNAAEAQTVSLPVGGEASVNFTTLAPTLVRLFGSVVTSDGKPAQGLSVNLRSAAADWVPVRSGGRMASDGQFAFTRVAPGSYWLDVGREDGTGETASVPVTIQDEELSGVTIVTAPGATVSGRVSVEGDGPAPATMRLRIYPADGGFSLARRAGESIAVAADGSFTVGTVTGRVLFGADAPGWVITSVTVNGEDRTDVAFDTSGHLTVPDVRVVLTNRTGSLSGRVTDDRQRPLARHAVVLLRLDPTGLMRHRAQVVASGADGRFSVNGLPAGEYAVGALPDLETNYQFSPELQDRLRRLGQRVVVGEGETLALEIQANPAL